MEVEGGGLEGEDSRLDTAEDGLKGGRERGGGDLGNLPMHLERLHPSSVGACGTLGVETNGLLHQLLNGLGDHQRPQRGAQPLSQVQGATVSHPREQVRTNPPLIIY